MLISLLSISKRLFGKVEPSAALVAPDDFTSEVVMFLVLRDNPPFVRMVNLKQVVVYVIGKYSHVLWFIFEPVERIYGAIGRGHKLELQVGFEPTTASLQN